jgi:hypothetical protein
MSEVRRYGPDRRLLTLTPTWGLVGRRRGAGGLIDGYGVLFVRRCQVASVTGLRGNDDAGARSSDVHETGVAHRISSQY